MPKAVRVYTPNKTTSTRQLTACRLRFASTSVVAAASCTTWSTFDGTPTAAATARTKLARRDRAFFLAQKKLTRFAIFKHKMSTYRERHGLIPEHKTSTYRGHNSLILEHKTSIYRGRHGLMQEHKMSTYRGRHGLMQDHKTST